MQALKGPLTVPLTFAALALVASVLGEKLNWRWAGDWLSPVSMLIFLITLGNWPNLRSRPGATRRERLAAVARSVMVIVPIWCLMELRIASNDPIAMRFLGLTWTMSGENASSLLSYDSFAVGIFVVGVSWWDSTRTAASTRATH
jgi:hypothetical protein